MMGILGRSCRRSALLLYHRRRRRCYSSTPKILLDKPALLNCTTRVFLPLSHSDALFFFARNYAKTSRKKTESDDYLLNEQITANPIRLVTDSGHQVVSRREALDYAKKLKLDLVEVQSNANPPVCKVMDYNLEKFNQKQREKERAKNKPEGLRKDECREIRFTAKTEQRDLERKAEIAKQLMDRGCRVKCMAMGAGQKILEEQLQRFLVLVEDVSNVESGPRIEQRNGYFIARHIKFGGANKKEGQQTIKSVENGTGKPETDNIKKTDVSEKKKEDTAVSPKEEFLDKSAQFEEHAPVEQFEEIVDNFPSIDTAEAIANDICLSTSETKMHTANTIQQESVVGDTNHYSETSVSEKIKEDTAVSPKEEFLDKSAQFEEHAPVEQFEEIVDKFPSIDTAEAIANGICLSSSQTEMHTANTIHQQESVVGDINHYSETETYLENSSRNHDSSDQARQAVADTCSVWHRYNSSNIEQQFASDQSLKQCRDPTKVKAPEFLKKGHFSSPLSTNLNNGPEKHHRHRISDGKLSESASREDILGRIHSDQGHCAANVGRVHSVDSHFKANVKDITDDCHINVSITREVTKRIVEELQTTPATLNNSHATQEEQLPRVPILADSLRQVLIKRSSGDQYTSKTEKRPLSDLLLKQSSESRWAVLRQVKPSCFDDNTNTATHSITTNLVEKVRTSHANLNDTTTQVQQNMTTGSSKIPADDQEESASKARMRPSTTMFPEQADEFQWATFGQVKPSHFEGDNNTGRQDELGISNAKHHANQGHHVSNIGKQIPVSSVSLPTKVLGNGAPYMESGVANGKQRTPSEHEKQGYFDPNKAIQKPLNSSPKLDNNTGDSNAMSSIPLVDTRQVPYESPCGERNRASSIGKQNSTDSFSKKVSAPVGSRWGIFSQPKGYVVENQIHPAKATEEQSKDWSGVLEGPNIDVSAEAQSDAAPRHLHTQNQRKVPTSSIGIGKQDQKQNGRDTVDQPRQVKPSCFDDNTNTVTPSITTNLVEKLQTSHANLNDTTTQVEQNMTRGSSKIPADDQEESVSKARMQSSTNMLSEQADEFQWATSRQIKPSHFKGDNNTERRDELGLSNAKHPANQGHHVSNIGRQIPVSSVSLPTKVLGNGAPYTESGVANGKQPTPSEHEKQGYFDPNKAIQKPLNSTPKLDNNTGDSNAMSSIPLVDTRQVPYESPYGERNRASSIGKQNSTDSFSKKVSAPVGSRWGIFSQPKGYVVENQIYPAKATEEQSKDWSGVLEGPNIDVSAEVQSDAAPRHLHIQNQRKVPTSSIGIGKQDQKQTGRDTVDQPRQKSWGVFSMKVPTKAADDKGKPEI